MSSGQPSISFWATTVPPVPPRPAAEGQAAVNVVVVGAGYTGLWAALELKRREPAMTVMILEASRIGAEASGRNGGWIDPSLTHGVDNGELHFPGEIAELERLGRESYADLLTFISEQGIDCDLELTGQMEFARRPHEVDTLGEWASAHRRYGHRVEELSAQAAQEYLPSRAWLGAVRRPDQGGILNPLKLTFGLADAAERHGVAIHENSAVRSIAQRSGGVVVRTEAAEIMAEIAIVATNVNLRVQARAAGWRYAPVHDHLYVSEPLTSRQLAEVGWRQREGCCDIGQFFHSFRLTADNRMLWAGYDAVYLPGNRIRQEWQGRDRTWVTLRRHFDETLPQLRGLRFAFRWTGVIAATTSFTPLFGKAKGGRLLYAGAYTGLGVAAAKFAGRILAEQFLAPRSDLLRLDYVRKQPFCFPPEPMRTPVIAIMQHSLARYDRTGRRPAMLRALNAAGIGFSC